MWSTFVFLPLVGFIAASSTPVWRYNREYVYTIQGRTLASLDIANEFSGILMKATLRIQTRPDGNLQGLLVNPQYAQIHSELSEGPMTHIPNAEVNWKSLEMSRKSFQIVINRGIITDLIVTRNMPNWEGNILKGIISQLQLNINHWESYNSEKSNRHDSASFIIPEETVSGTTDTLYEINPMPEYLLLNSKIVPDFQSTGEDNCDILEIVKHKNYSASIELPSFIYGLGNVFGTKAASNVMGEFFVRNTMSRALVTECTKQFTIQNSFTLNEVSVNPTFADNQKGSVVSMWNVTLEKLKPQDKILEDVPEPVRLGGLVYSYGKPYSESNEVVEKQREQDYIQYNGPAWQRITNNYFYSTSKSAQDSKQEKPELNKPAEYPMLPYTVGNEGKSIKYGLDIINSVVNIAQDIGSDLQDPRKTLTDNTLAKFSNLIQLIRTMDEQELKKAGKDLYSNNDQDRSRYAAWATYRDAVAESGTSPSLLVIMSWIESRNLKLVEAAYIMAQMVNSVQTPTTEYIQTFYEFVKKPIVTSQWPLNETAILSLSELTRQVYFDNEFYKTNFPRKSFKNLRENQGRKLVRETIIPYFKKCLDKAIIQDEPSKIHTYIRALGFIGDIEILRVFEPYLEGKKHCSQYQRTLMVIAMDKLVKTYPEVAQAVLFRIYQNSGEYQPLRVAAVYQLIRTKPSVEMLQLMASYTKIDSQEEVNAAVKTSIQSAAALETDEFKELRYAAMMALPLLTDTEYGLQQGGNYLRNYFVNQLNLQYKETIQLFGSSDSFIPKGIKYALRSSEGGRRNQILNVQSWLTSVEQLIQVFYEQTESSYQYKEQQQQRLKAQQKNQWSSENIARILNMKSEASEQLEGSLFFMDTVLPIKMLSFNNDTIEQLPQLLKEFEKYLNEDKEINEVKLFNGDDAIIAVPLEMGVPFVFTYDAPRVLKVHGKVKAAVQTKLSENGRIQYPDFIKIRTDITVTFGSKVQGHVSFFTPFDRRQYYSGFEKNMQVHLPIAGTFEVNLKKSELTFDIEPKETHKEAPLFHYSTWPFTSWRDIADLRTLVAQHHNQYIKPNRIRTVDTIIGKEQTGLAYHMKMEHVRNNIQMSDLNMFWKKGNLFALKNLWSNSDIQYSQLNITYLSQESLTKNIQVRLGYQQNYKQKGESNSFSWNKLSATTKSSERSNILLKGVGASTRNVKSQALDLSIRFKGGKNIEHIVSGAVSESNVDPRSRVYIFYKQDLQTGKPHEITFEAINDVPNTNTLNLDYALATEPKAISAVTLTFDTTHGEKGVVKADFMLTRSEKRKEYLKDLPMYQQCKRDMRVNNKQSPACVNMTLNAHFLDKMNVNIKYDHFSSVVEDVVETMFDHIRYMYYPSLETDYEKGSHSEKQIELESQFDQDLKYVNISVTTGKQKSTFKDVEMGDYTRRIFVVHPTFSLLSRFMSKVLEIDTINPVCITDQTQVTTFSNLTYSAALSRYWTVLAQYAPSVANEGEQIYSVHKQLECQLTNLVVLARRSMSPLKSQTDVKIVISSPDTDFESIDVTISPENRSSSEGKIAVYVNGQQTEVSDSVCHDIKNGYIQIYALPNGEIKVEVKNIFHLTYDGVSTKLETTSNLLRGATRGLCGSWTDQQNEDFLTPLNCYVDNSEKFVRSYEVEGHEGDQTRQELSQDSQQCVQKNMPLYINIVRLRDILSYIDMEQSEGNNCTVHHTRYLEQNSEICFTTRVVPTCSNQCQAQGYITKTVPVHCIAKNNVALLWKKQIDSGGNPDFSHKAEHKKLQMEVPQACSKE